jgi:hypothetical protein
LVFAPPELLERLAALTPRPRIDPVLCYGVFARGLGIWPILFGSSLST